MNPRLPPNENVLIAQIVDAMFLETDGTTTDRRVMCRLPEGWNRMGYRLSGIQCVTRTENRTTNHRWNAEIAISVDGQEWWLATPNDLFGYVSTDTHAVQTELTDTTKFRAPFIRINLACSNSSGVARESATVSMWLIFIFQT